MALYITPKDPNEDLDYQVNWAERLDPGDTIQTSIWFLEWGPDANLDLTKYPDTNTDTTANVWLSAGTLGKEYRVTNRIVTVNNRKMDQTVIVRIRRE